MTVKSTCRHLLCYGQLKQQKMKLAISLSIVLIALIDATQMRRMKQA